MSSSIVVDVDKRKVALILCPQAAGRYDLDDAVGADDRWSCESRLCSLRAATFLL